MNVKELTKQLVQAGIEVKDGKVKKSDIKAYLSTSAKKPSGTVSFEYYPIHNAHFDKVSKKLDKLGIEFEEVEHLDEDESNYKLVGDYDDVTNFLRGAGYKTKEINDGITSAVSTTASWSVKPEGIVINHNVVEVKGPMAQMSAMRNKDKYGIRMKWYTLEEAAKKMADKTGYDINEIKKALKKAHASTQIRANSF